MTPMDTEWLVSFDSKPLVYAFAWEVLIFNEKFFKGCQVYLLNFPELFSSDFLADRLDHNIHVLTVYVKSRQTGKQ